MSLKSGIFHKPKWTKVNLQKGKRNLWGLPFQVIEVKMNVAVMLSESWKHRSFPQFVFTEKEYVKRIPFLLLIRIEVFQVGFFPDRKTEEKI